MKIANLEELKAYSLAVCEEYPEDKDSSDLTNPLCDVALLKAAIPNLPQSYCDVASRIALNGKVIGYFLLSPEAFGKSTLIQTLVEADSVNSPFASRFRELGCHHVANYEAEPIGVAGESELNEGEVFKLDIGSPKFESTKLGSTFEDFLLIAASLDMAQM